MTRDEILAAARPIVSFGLGAATTWGIITIDQDANLVTAFDHIVNGVKEIAIGISPFITVGLSLWSRWKASNTAKVVSVAALPGVTVVATPEIAAVAKSPDVVSTADVKIVAK